MISLETVYSDEYITTTYSKQMCTQCSNKCDKCTADKMEINRYIVRKNSEDIPTVSYKCKEYNNPCHIERNGLNYLFKPRNPKFLPKTS